MSSFLNIQEYPRAWAFAAELQARAEALLHEGVAALNLERFQEWPEPINQGGWQTYGVKWQGKMLPEWDAFTAGRMACLAGDFVLNCGYSLMLPGARITTHVGYTGSVLRLHIGLSIPPEGDCALVVGGERRQWETGGVLFFDDTVEHSAHNLAETPRLVLLVDLLREACR